MRMHLWSFIQKWTFTEVIIVKPPREFKDKDDLYDAKVNDFFTSSQQFLDYCLNNQIKKRVSFDRISALGSEHGAHRPLSTCL